MSIDILVELQHEVRRLMIAGSGLAAGDVRLQKVLPQLEKLGESAPVFKRMAQAVSGVVEAPSGGAAMKLLELGTLLQSVLYTQGKTETKEELLPVQGTPSRLATAVPYRKLAPLLEALMQKGQGRMEQLRQAYEERTFLDLRVVPAAVAALDDSYAEIPEFLQTKVIPEYGLEALPALRQQLKLDGGRGASRRLELIHQLQQGAESELLLRAAWEGSMEVRTTAIELLGDDPAQEAFLLEQADDKKKDIRRAAFFGLSRLATEAAIQRLFQALHSKDQDLAIEPVRQCRANALTLDVIGKAEQALEAIVQRANVEEAVQQLQAELRSLQGKRVPEVAALLQKLLSTPGFIVPETETVQEAAAGMLLELDLPETNGFLVTLHEEYNRKFIRYSFRAAVRILPPEDVYERFYRDLKDKKSLPAKELMRELQQLTLPLYSRMQGHDSEQSEQQWDDRWVQLFVQLDEEELVCRLIRERDAKVAAYLIQKCKAAQGLNQGLVAEMLMVLFGMGVPEAPQLLMEVLERSGGKSYYYFGRVQLELLGMLPRAYAGRLEQAAEAFSNQWMKKQLQEIAATVASKPEELAEEPQELEEKGQGLWGWIKSRML